MMIHPGLNAAIEIAPSEIQIVRAEDLSSDGVRSIRLRAVDSHIGVELLIPDLRQLVKDLEESASFLEIVSLDKCVTGCYGVRHERGPHLY